MQGYSRLQFDGPFLEKHTRDFVFVCGVRCLRNAPQPVAWGDRGGPTLKFLISLVGTPYCFQRMGG